jgi:hypothetical protein
MKLIWPLVSSTAKRIVEPGDEHRKDGVIVPTTRNAPVSE